MASHFFEQSFTPDRRLLSDLIALTSQTFYEYSLVIPDKPGLLKIIRGFQKGNVNGPQDTQPYPWRENLAA